jgi:hypothetical protein
MRLKNEKITPWNNISVAGTGISYSSNGKGKYRH